MKGMPLPFDFEGKGVLDLELLEKNKSFFSSDTLLSSYFFNNNKKNCFLNSRNNSFCEPTSVLDSARLIPSRPTSSSTLSSSLAGGGGAASTDTAGVAAVSDANNPSPKWQADSTTATSSDAAAAAGGGGADSAALQPVPPSLEIGTTGGGTNPEKFAMEDWESVLSESVTAVSPTTQEQSILRLIMGDVEDPLNKVLPAASEFDYSGGFGVVDQGFGGDGFSSAGFMSTLPNFVPNNNRSSAEKIGNLASSNPISPNLPTNNNFKFSHHNIMNNPSSLSNHNLGPLHHHHHHNQTAFDSEIKPPIFNMNHFQTHQSHNPPSFLPLSSYPQQQDPNIYAPPQAKRHNPGHIDAETGQIPKGPFTDTGQHPELFTGRHQLHNNISPLELLPHHYLQQQKPKTGDELVGQQAVVDQLYKAAELVQTGNPPLAQGILARLNHHHHLSPIGKPFYRAAFYFKESLQHLLQQTTTTTINNTTPLAIVHKISAYKSFSEISPLIQFSNFTCNQAILESLQGFDRIRIVDFDIGYGGQWASLMQELALRGGGAGPPPQLRITALASPSSPDHLELGLTRENLIQFANEINIGVEFEAVNIDSLSSNSWVPPFHLLENEAVVVNLPVGYISSDRQLSVLRFVKQLSPRIVVSVDRGCDRTDLPFANHVIHALQSYSNLLESLDAVNVNMEALQKIERFLIQPGIERIVLGRFRSPEKTQNWRALFLSSGFSPVMFSNFAESQAECVVKRTPVRGFQVEKRQSSLVLCWQRKELISASAWRC